MINKLLWPAWVVVDALTPVEWTKNPYEDKLNEMITSWVDPKEANKIVSKEIEANAKAQDASKFKAEPIKKQAIKKITFKEASDEVTNKVSPNDKAKLDKLKDLLKSTGKTVSAWIISKIKKHPYIAWLSAAVATPMIIGYVTWEDVEDEQELENTVNNTLSEENTKPKNVMYKDRDIAPTIWWWWVFTWKDWKTRAYKTLEEAKNDIDTNLENYYKVELEKASKEKDWTKIQELIQRAKERWIDLEEWLGL